MKRVLILLLVLVMSGCKGNSQAVVSVDDGRSVDTGQMEAIDNKKVCWGLGKNTNEKKQPIDALNANDRYQTYDAVFVGDGAKPVIYLTFDNGYENGNDAKILDILKEKQVSAMFFVTYDYVKDNPELVQRMLDEGHQVGNHSYKHHSFPDISIQEVIDEVITLEEYLMQEFQYQPKYVRPPKGEFSNRSLAICQALGYTSVLWSFAYYDYNVNDQPNPDTALKKLTDALHPGAIYLLHAVSSTNAAILGDFIDAARQAGYTFSPLDF